MCLFIEHVLQFYASNHNKTFNSSMRDLRHAAEVVFFVAVKYSIVKDIQYTYIFFREWVVGLVPLGRAICLCTVKYFTRRYVYSSLAFRYVCNAYKNTMWIV